MTADRPPPRSRAPPGTTHSDNGSAATTHSAPRNPPVRPGTVQPDGTPQQLTRDEPTLNSGVRFRRIPEEMALSTNRDVGRRATGPGADRPPGRTRGLPGTRLRPVDGTRKEVDLRLGGRPGGHRAREPARTGTQSVRCEIPPGERGRAARRTGGSPPPGAGRGRRSPRPAPRPAARSRADADAGPPPPLDSRFAHAWGDHLIQRLTRLTVQPRERSTYERPTREGRRRRRGHGGARRLALTAGRGSPRRPLGHGRDVDAAWAPLRRRRQLPGGPPAAWHGPGRGM